jgi:hypothetical protein
MDQIPPHGNDESVAARFGLAVGEFIVRYVIWFCGSVLTFGLILPRDVVFWVLAAAALIATIFHTRITSTRVQTHNQ